MQINPLLPCTPECTAYYNNMYETLDKMFQKGDFGHPAAIIELGEFKDCEDYISKIHYNKRYGYKKALKLGYVFERSRNRKHIGDVVEINRSKAHRQGNPMREDYLKSVEEKGGFLKIPTDIPPIKCFTHFNSDFGVFKYIPGYMQGEIQVNKRMFAYNSVHVVGEYAFHSMIIGHGDYLKDDIMSLLHIGTIDFIMKSTKVKYFGYHIYNGGKQGLQDWKRYMLFKPVICQWK
jgi:hypothetical protein